MTPEAMQADLHAEEHQYLSFLEDERNKFSGQSASPDNLYTPRSILTSYFVGGQGSLDDLLKEVLKEEAHIPPAEIVLDRYLLVLTILLSIGKAEILSRFIERDYNDERLPFFDRPRHFPRPGGVSFFDQFFDAQFRFCPVKFVKHSVNLEIDPQQILPLTNKKLVAKYGLCTTYQIYVHEEYDSFVQDSNSFDIDLGTDKVCYQKSSKFDSC